MNYLMVAYTLNQLRNSFIKDQLLSLWVKIFSQTFLIITSCLSSCLVGKKHIDKMTQIEINRSTFLNNIFKDEDKEKAEENPNQKID